MADLLRDSEGIPIPQYMNDEGTYEASRGEGGAFRVSLAGGQGDALAGWQGPTPESPTIWQLLNSILTQQARHHGATASTTNSQKEVTNTATNLAMPFTGEIRIMNIGGHTLYIGLTDTVTTDTGYPVPPDTQFVLPIQGVPVYAISEEPSKAAVMVVI